MSDLEAVLELGMDWSIREGYAWAEDKEHCEENGRMLQVCVCVFILYLYILSYVTATYYIKMIFPIYSSHLSWFLDLLFHNHMISLIISILNWSLLFVIFVVRLTTAKYLDVQRREVSHN